MKRMRMVSVAEQEMLEAAAYYEQQAEGLATAFYDQIEQASFEIARNPETWPLISETIRKRSVGRFPFILLYRIDPDEIIIQAVMHTSRNPKHWQRRI